MNANQTIANFNAGEIVNSLNAQLLALVFALGLRNILLIMISIFMFLIINVAGYYNHHIYKVKRRRVFYLDKINSNSYTSGANI